MGGSLLRAASSAAGILQRFIEPVQLVAEIGKPGLFRPQLLLRFNFPSLTLLFFTFQRFQSALEHRKSIAIYLPLCGRIFRVVDVVFSLLDVGGHTLSLVLNSGEPLGGVVEMLRGARRDRFLALQAIDENLRALRSDDGGLHVLSELAHFHERVWVCAIRRNSTLMR